MECLIFIGGVIAGILSMGVITDQVERKVR